MLEVDQSLDEDPAYDIGGFVARAGGWESSGIVDTSSIWGPGWFLIGIQAGSLILESEDGMLGDRAVTFEREGGQLLRVKIPAPDLAGPVGAGRPAPHPQRFDWRARISALIARIDPRNSNVEPASSTIFALTSRPAVWQDGARRPAVWDCRPTHPAGPVIRGVSPTEES